MPPFNKSMSDNRNKKTPEHLVLPNKKVMRASYIQSRKVAVHAYIRFSTEQVTVYVEDMLRNSAACPCCGKPGLPHVAAILQKFEGNLVTYVEEAFEMK
jgi:hypothetical protein